jgi:ribonuclease HI
MADYIIFTDGSCLGNPGAGGWAFAMSGAKNIEKSGGEKLTTNNRMELMAVISALSELKEGSSVEIHTDSQYVKNGMETWIKGWKKKGWKSSTGAPVKNQDLWARLDELASKFKIEWSWVRGHNGDEMNERVDFLARTAAESML